MSHAARFPTIVQSQTVIGIRNPRVYVEAFGLVTASAGFRMMIGLTDMKRAYLPIALTVDVEGSEEKLPRRLEVLLELFAQRGASATFFFLGEVARALPKLVGVVAEAGHEVGFHGERHVPLSEVGPMQLRAELAAWRPRLEDLAQGPVQGYRAPYFSMVPQTAWALPLLADAGFGYDASVHPGWHPIGGWQGAPRSPVLLDSTDLVVWPVPVLCSAVPLAFSGGAGFRFLPMDIIRWCLCRGRLTGRPGMIYFHSWESEPPTGKVASLRYRGASRLASYRRWAEFTGRIGRRHLLKKLGGLLKCLDTPTRPMGKIVNGLPALRRWNPSLAATGYRGDGT